MDISRFDQLRQRKPLTKKERSLYRGWHKYLSNSRLDSETIHQRAAHAAAAGRKVPSE